MSYNLLSQNAFWVTNKKVAQKFGLECAVFLSDLVTKYEYHKSYGELKEHNGDYYFYYTSEDIEESTTLSYHKQKTCIDKLAKAGFIGVVRIGMPGILHFKIFELHISNFLNCTVEKNRNVYNKNRIIRIDNNSIVQNEFERPTKEKKELEVSDDFEVFWDLYDKKVAKEKCIKLWLKLKEKEKEKILEVLPAYIEATPEKRFRRNPDTYLRNKGWLDEIMDPKTQQKSKDYKIVEDVNQYWQ